MKQTIQRQAILKYMKSVRSHPTAEQVYDALKRDYPSMTLATVYRNLNTLADLGIVLRFKVNNKYHFDGFNDLHVHFYCESCERIFDIEYDGLEDDLKAITKKLEKQGKSVNEYQIVFYGICENCKKQTKNMR